MYGLRLGNDVITVLEIDSEPESIASEELRQQFGAGDTHGGAVAPVLVKREQ